MAKAGTIRGLQMFISDIRACANREAEARRVDKELAKIRGKFGDEKKALTAYDRKKYVWKLLYIYMLGYDVEFGHKQACDLIPASKYSEKQVGYMACSILMNERDEFLRLSINAIHSDLISRNEAFQCLALTFVGNIAGPEMAEALTPDVMKLINAGSGVRPIVRKKAALCLLRLLRKTPADQALVTPDAFAPVAASLLEERDLGLLLASATLLLGIVTRFGPAGYESCVPRIVRTLERLVTLRDITPDYTYYGIASPWLQVKCLRLLQQLPPPETPALQRALHDSLQTIFSTCGEQARSPTVNKANAQHAILFEAIALCLAMEAGRDLLGPSVASLGRFLSVKEPNVRYLALETLTRLALVPDVSEAIVNHQATITANLKDPDVSIRRRALDLLFTMTDAGNAAGVVGELVKYLTVADFSMREELVLKVAILAEKYAPDVKWYVDTALALLERAGDFCGEDIWHRVVQLVTNNGDAQGYAAEQVVEALKRGANHESLLCTSACVLGEYGRLVPPSKATPREMHRLLSQHLAAAGGPTRGLLLSAALKLMLQAPGDAELASEVRGTLERYAKSADPDLQQRAVEYLALAKDPAGAAAAYVLPMPKWEGRESALLRRLQVNEGGESDAASISSALAATTLGAAPSEDGTQRAASLAPALSGAPSAAASAAATPRGSPTKRAAAAAAAAAGLLGTPKKDAAAAAAATPTAADAPAEAPAEAPAAAAAAAAPQPAAAAAAAPVAPPIIDLLGDDIYDAPAPSTTTPAAAAAAAAAAPVANGTPTAAAAAAPAPAPAKPAAPIDPLDELFGGLAGHTPAAAAPAAAPSPVAAPQAAPSPFAAAAAPQQPAPVPAAAAAPPAFAALQAQGSALSASSSFGGSGAFSGGGAFGPGAPPTASVDSSAALYAAPAPAAPSPVPPSPLGPYAGYTGNPAAAGFTGAPAGFGNPMAGPTGYMGGPAGVYSNSPGMNPIAAGFTGAPAGFGSPYGAPPYGAAAAGPYGAPYGAPVPQYAAVAPPPGQEGGDVQRWYNTLLLRDQGVLYEDALIQVGLTARFTGAHCDATLFIGNKHPAAALQPLGLALVPPASGALQLSLGQAPPALAPKQQVQLPLTARALAAAGDPPVLHLSYGPPGGAPGQMVQVPLRLPLLAHKFMAPEAAIAKDAFFAQWKSFTGPPHKQQEMVERSPALGPLPVEAATAALRGLNFGVTHGALDPNPHNDAGAALFTAGPPGAEGRALVQVRLEGNPQNRAQFRVTVASPDAALAAAVKGTLAALIRGAALPPA